MIRRKSVKLSWSERGGVGYLTLPDHPGRDTARCVKRSIDLKQLDQSLEGPQIILDIDDQNRVIGIEVLR